MFDITKHINDIICLKNVLLLYQYDPDFKLTSLPILHPLEVPVLKMNWSSVGFFHTGLFGAASALLSESS